MCSKLCLQITFLVFVFYVFPCCLLFSRLNLEESVEGRKGRKGKYGSFHTFSYFPFLPFLPSSACTGKFPSFWRHLMATSNVSDIMKTWVRINVLRWVTVSQCWLFSHQINPSHFWINQPKHYLWSLSCVACCNVMEIDLKISPINTIRLTPCVIFACLVLESQ